jgi:hypothetical protein
LNLGLVGSTARNVCYIIAGTYMMYVGDALYGASGVFPARSVVASKLMIKEAMAPSDHDRWVTHTPLLPPSSSPLDASFHPNRLAPLCIFFLAG